jgi:hypothetical protein
MLRTDLSSIESLRSSVQILLYWFLASVLDRSDTGHLKYVGQFLGGRILVDHEPTV